MRNQLDTHIHQRKEERCDKHVYDGVEAVVGHDRMCEAIRFAVYGLPFAVW